MHKFMKPEIYIQEEQPTKNVFCFFFFSLEKSFRTLKLWKPYFSQMQMKKKKKETFTKINNELNTVKPVNISRLSPLDQFTN